MESLRTDTLSRSFNVNGPGFSQHDHIDHSAVGTVMTSCGRIKMFSEGFAAESNPSPALAPHEIPAFVGLGVVYRNLAIFALSVILTYRTASVRSPPASDSTAARVLRPLLEGRPDGHGRHHRDRLAAKLNNIDDTRRFPNLPWPTVRQSTLELFLRKTSGINPPTSGRSISPLIDAGRVYQKSPRLPMPRF